MADLDYSKLYARFAELQNASQVAREFGLSRFKVNKLWGSLNDEEKRNYYEQIAMAREAALETHKTDVFDSTKNYAQRVDEVRLKLLSKLELCISELKTTDRNAMTRIKDASVALKNLDSIIIEVEDTHGNDIYERLTKLSKIDERKS